MSTFATFARLGFALALCLSGAAAAQSLAQDFVTPPSDSRPLVRWWWFGPAAERDELAREIAAMRAGGFGGFEIQPVYPLALDDPAKGIRNLSFLSEEFLQAVRFAADTGRAQGLRVDITLGSGWPFGGPNVPLTEAAANIVMVRVPIPRSTRRAALPSIKAGEHLVAAFLADSADLASARALSFKRNATSISLAPENRERMLLVFVQSRTGQQVKRAGVGGEGFVLDHLNAAAVRHHLDVVGEKLVAAFGETPPYSVFCDSLEVYGADWTDDFPAQFRRRRGYDLTPHLPALFADAGATTAAIRHDWALTLSELVDERFLTTVSDWAKAHHTQLRAQVYGVPPVTSSSNRLVPLAEGEGTQWRQFTPTRWTSSANHLYGRSVTSAESWTWLHSQPFRATPLDVKVEADRLLLEGVNQFVAHGWPYSPPAAGEPGWSLYAAAVFNNHNPWWPVMADVNAYLQRLSYLLRQGEPVADVAVLLPTDDAFARMTPGHASVTDQMPALLSGGVFQQILECGYSFDYVDGPALESPGFKHRVLILPNIERIAPAHYRRIAAFAKRGGVVIVVGQLPRFSGGFRHAAVEAREVRAISSSLFAGVHAYHVEETALGATLRAVMPPDLAGSPPALGFVHRKLSDGDLYFVANTGNQPLRAQLVFRSQTRQAQWWEPRTGQAHSWTPGEDVVLAPYESRIFVFGAAASAPVVETVARKAAATPIDLSSGWRVLVDGHSREISLPHSWTQDATTRFYSGEAIYTRTLELTPAQLAAGQVVLNFGSPTPLDGPPHRWTAAQLESPVREAAEVFVDGKRAGSVWAPPYTLNLAGFLHAGSNRLEIRVTNTAINELAGQTAPDYRTLNARYGQRFDPPKPVDGPLPSGLLQPLSLVQL